MACRNFVGVELTNVGIAMMIQFRLLTVVFVLAFCYSTEIVAQESNTSQLTTTTQTVSDAEVSSGTSQQVKAKAQIESGELPPYSVGNMPDFTDDGLSMLVSRAGRANPVYVSTCVRSYFNAFFGTLSGPIESITFVACDPLGDIAEACDNGVMGPWTLTSNQKTAWKNTSVEVRGKVLTMLQAYKAAISTEANVWFPCIIRGLDFGGTNVSPYTDVVIRVIQRADGSTYEWWVELKR